jgi:hypothetical protein
MSTQSHTVVPIDPNDPRLHTPEDEGYRRKRSQHIFELDANLASKSKEHDDCGKMAESIGCSGHTPPRILGEITRSCKQRFSLCCGPRITLQRLAKHEDVIYTITDGVGDDDDSVAYPDRIRLITVTKQIARRGEDIAAITHLFWKITRSLISEAGPKPYAPYFIKPCTNGFDGTRIVFSLFWWGPFVSPERFKSAYTALGIGTDVSVMTRPNEHAEELFKQAFEILVPHDPIEQAGLEVAFHKVDMITTYQRNMPNLRVSVPSKEGEPVEGIESDEHPLNCDDCTVSNVPVCPECGKHADLKSRLHRAHAPAEEVHAAGWLKWDD